AELKREGLAVHLILNAYWEPLEFELPPTAGGPWRRWIDTSLPSPEDIVEWPTAPPVAGSPYRARPRSGVILYTGAAWAARLSLFHGGACQLCQSRLILGGGSLPLHLPADASGPDAGSRRGPGRTAERTHVPGLPGARDPVAGADARVLHVRLHPRP